MIKKIRFDVVLDTENPSHIGVKTSLAKINQDTIEGKLLILGVLDYLKSQNEIKTATTISEERKGGSNYEN